jgi:hypothetical protein
MSITSSCTTNPSTSNGCYFQTCSGVTTDPFEANTGLRHRRRAATSLNRTDIPGAVPPRTVEVIGAWREAAAYSILATESIVGTVLSRCEAETGGISAAVRKAATSLPLALGSGADGQCWRCGRGGRRVGIGSE